MSGRIDQRAEARRDLVAHFVFLGQDNLRTAHRFLKAAERAFAQLARMPGLGSPWETSNPEFAGLRVWPIRGFKQHLIFYQPTDRGIEVIRVLHAAQDIESIFEAL